MEKKPINWNEEGAKLQKVNDMPKGEWIKLKAGVYKLKISEVGQEYLSQIREGSEVKKRLLKVIYDGKPFLWGVTVGKTESSLWGQLVLLGKSLGDLTNKEITLVVKGSNKETSYTVLEALPYMKPKQEVVV